MPIQTLIRPHRYFASYHKNSYHILVWLLVVGIFFLQSFKFYKNEKLKV